MSDPQVWRFVAHIEFQIEDVTAVPKDGDAIETQVIVMRLRYRNGDIDTMVLDPEAYQSIITFAQTELLEPGDDMG